NNPGSPLSELFQNGLPTFANTVGTGGQGYTIFGGGMNQFLVQVNALESRGDAKILSRPAVLTMDNVQSTFERTETFYVRLEGREEVQLEEVTYGTKLLVTPHVISHPDGRRRIQMMVVVEDGSAADSGEVDNIPRTVNSKVETQAVVAEGQALVLGGHYSEVFKESKTGVPVLSRLPGVGGLFRNKRRDTNTYERLFVISPRIVTVGDLPVVGDDAELQTSFDGQLADPVYRMPSVSDSREAIQERLRRENEEIRRQEEVDAGETEGLDESVPAVNATDFGGIYPTSGNKVRVGGVQLPDGMAQRWSPVQWTDE
ncbi:MAG: hypothetical protein LUC93_14560, partial [Planctomycetaceae bacterium]|nr:hypothetical protein [Planctomycetaceae bacterium]